MSDTPVDPSGFKGQAERLAKDPTAIARLLETASKKAQTQAERISQVRSDFAKLMRMLGSYAKGDYRKVPWTSLVTGLLAVMYFVNPMDLIPDFILGTGYLDDASVIAFCLNGLRKDLAEYVRWEAEQPSDRSASTPEP